MRKKKDTALEHALRMVGGPAKLARFITEHYDETITVQAVCGWKRCPPKRVIQVETATGGRVPRHRLRPDIFPVPA